MKNTNRNTLSIIIAGVVLLSACTNDKAKTKDADVRADTHSKTSDTSEYGVVNNWADDLKNLRTAISQGDVPKMKNYFRFPVVADTTQVWEAIYSNADESKRPQTFPNTFTYADLEKHYGKLFDSAFIKSLQKVKSEKLFQKGEYTTPKIKENNQSYYMIANYDKAANMLQLSVTFSGGAEENGEEVSEGEYAILYFFKVEENKHLKFDKILFAG